MTNTNVTRKLLTLIPAAIACAAGLARAEEAPPLPTSMEEIAPAIQAESIENYIHKESPVSDIGRDSYNLFSDCPAPPESSGTWLRRGWWSADIDGMILVRKWDRQAAVLAGDNSSIRTLNIGRSMPTEALARLNLTRFLFRDAKNRDHRFEFNVMGGGEFYDDCQLEAVTANSLAVPGNIDRFANVSFDGASTMEASYASRFNSFEWNYSVTSRMERDRMELQPDGRWIRRANSGLTYHGLAGLRYIDLSENIYWSAEDIINGTVNDMNGDYRIETSNDLITFQAGAGLTYEADRWSVTLFSRGGVALNDAKSNAWLSFTDPVTGEEDEDFSFSSNARDGSMPVVIQGGVMGKYHLRPNVSIKAGYEFIYMTAMALAPHQTDFVPADGKVQTTAVPFMHGLTIGSEFYW